MIPDALRIVAHRILQSRLAEKYHGKEEEIKLLEKIAYMTIGNIPTLKSPMSETPKDSMQSKGEVSRETIALEHKAGVFHAEKVMDLLKKTPSLKSLLRK